MNKISVDNMPNQAFCSENIYLGEDYILLSPETPMLPTLKRRLFDWHYKSVLAKGSPKFTEIISSGDAEGILLKNSSEESEEAIEADEFYKSLCAFTSKLFIKYREGNEPKVDPVSEQIKKLIQMTKTHTSYLMSLTEYESDDIDYNVSQSVKTAILSIAMSETLKLPAHKQIELGIGALLHRIGSMNIPQELFYSKRALTPDEKKSVTLFPVLGFKSLKAAEFPTSVALAVLEHRENVDGSGYPRGFTGDKISLYGKIISVASAYCATVSKRPFRDNIDGYSGILELIKEKGRKYDEKVLRLLLLTLTVYPIGTYVMMTNGSVGIVSKTNSAEPKYPVLKMIFDSKKTYYADSPIMNTSPEDEVQIERALNRDEVEEIRANMINK